MKELERFVSEHIGDDVTRLVLDRKKWPEIDMDLAVNCIESRRKLKGKVQEWYEEPHLIFPRRLSAEQCSSSATGLYKAELASSICGSPRIADMTGGLGVDSWYFSKVASAVLYCEMLPELCDAARHNFAVLETGNIEVVNCAVVAKETTRNDVDTGRNGGKEKSPGEILAGFGADIVYMDPARRGEGGRKVFLIEECTPDVLTLKDEIFIHCRHVLLKLSPMADISMACARLGTCCREVHVVAAGGECKELLIWMDREWNGDYTIQAVELHKDGSRGVFTFSPEEERLAGQAGNGPITSYKEMNESLFFLFEPGKALMKAGAFNLISRRYGISKLGRSTHYYILSSENDSQNLRLSGKMFRILSCSPLDKRSIKAISQEYPRAEVTARNIPMNTDTLRKRLGATPSDDTHIFGLRSDSDGNLLFVTKCVQEES